MRRRIYLWLMRHVATHRHPDFLIGPPDNPYMRRWWVIPRNRFFNVFLHQICHDDDDRALHDHPWVNMSWLLAGSYMEHMSGGKFRVRSPGAVIMRRPTAAHRLALMPSPYGALIPCWTLFVTGPVVRQWGFLCPQGWRHWKDFVANGEKGQVGRGCD